jgi:deaminated glutathione amidase
VVDPLGGVVADTGDGPAVIRADLDPVTVVRARETNPSLANRRL